MVDNLYYIKELIYEICLYVERDVIENIYF